MAWAAFLALIPVLTPSLYCVAALYGPRTWTQWNQANLGHGKARVSLSPSAVLQDQKGPQWSMSPFAQAAGSSHQPPRTVISHTATGFPSVFG